MAVTELRDPLSEAPEVPQVAGDSVQLEKNWRSEPLSFGRSDYMIEKIGAP